MDFVEPLDEKQLGDLFDDRLRVGHSARPEGVPDLDDMGTDVTGQHANFLCFQQQYDTKQNDCIEFCLKAGGRYCRGFYNILPYWHFANVCIEFLRAQPKQILSRPSSDFPVCADKSSGEILDMPEVRYGVTLR